MVSVATDTRLYVPRGAAQIATLARVCGCLLAVFRYNMDVRHKPRLTERNAMEVKAKSKRLVDLRAYLEQERQRLTKELAHSDGLSTDEERAGLGNHMADDATIVFEQARSVGMHRAQERMLAEVEDALARIEDGTYGVCRHCGSAIDAARLRALPTASLCLSCQENREAR